MRTFPLLPDEIYQVQVLPLDLLHLSFMIPSFFVSVGGSWRHPPIAPAEAAQGGRAGRGAAPAQHARQTILKNCSRQRARMTCKAPSLASPASPAHTQLLSFARRAHAAQHSGGFWQGGTNHI